MILMFKQINKIESKSFLLLKSWLLYCGLTLFLLMIVGCAGTPIQNPTGQTQVPIQTPPGQNQESEAVSNPEPKVVSKEESQEIAMAFLRNSPTFRFDGMEATLRLASSEAGEKPNTWVFHYEFQSRQAGYGDRTGLMLAQVITDHRAQIVVEQGKIVSAVLDGKWDELRQKDN